ncbi:MAG TPA: nucleotidyltransferase domain-containing protein [Phenylobacterium sp.]|nr:nucleotidyltransferase domain-containing protein [Phenylobacterium sp.]
MTREDIIKAFADRARADERVAALFLGGSLGRGEGDAWSDVDLILVARPDHHAALAAEARVWADGVAEVVLWKTPYVGVPLFCAVTAEWLRFDLTVTVPGRVIGARSTLKPLVDHLEVWAGLPETLSPKPIAPAELQALTEETLRILGLLPLAVGRGEFAAGVTGAGLLRGQLIALMIAETEPPLPPGALHLSRVVSPEDLEILESQPGAVATRASVIAASETYARLFLPRARVLAAKVGAVWPDALEAATRAHWRRELALELP